MALWNVRQTDEFQDWFDQANGQLQEDIVANVEVLRLLGPSLGRPKVDTIKGSKIKNLKSEKIYEKYSGKRRGKDEKK